MRHQKANSNRPGSGRFSIAALGVLLASACLASLATAADGSEVNRPGGGSNGGNNGGGAADDETVGTLPSSHADGWFDLYRNVLVQRPRMYVEGRLDDIQSSILALRGSNDVLVQDQGSGIARLVFLGDAQVVFDRDMFHLFAFNTGVVVPRPALGSDSILQWGGNSATHQFLSASTYALPIAAMESSGGLDRAPMRFMTSFAGRRTVLGSRADSAFVVLTQTH